MKQPKPQQFLHWLKLRPIEVRSSNPACCGSLRQSRQECDHSMPLASNATDSQSLDTRSTPFVNKLKEHSNNSEEDRQRYYLCDYQYEGEKWCIEIPAESWEDAKARLKRIAYAEVIGEVKAIFPAQLGLCAKLLVWLRGLA